MTDGTDSPRLSDADAAALDALIDARACGREATPSTVSRLMSLLDSGRVDVSADLTDRVLRGVRLSASNTDAHLCPDDDEALSAWVLAGYNTARVPGSLRGRASRHEALASLVASGIGEPPTDLIARTLARIAADRESGPLVLEPTARSRGWRWSDAIGIAAMLLLAASVAWPVVASARSRGRQQLCQAHLQDTSRGLATYAGMYQDSLPVATAGLGGFRWWDVSPSEPRSNSSNLFELARQGFGTLAALSCPGNERADIGPVVPGARDWRDLGEISFSYQIMFGPKRPGWKQPAQVVVLSDRSPVVLRAATGQPIDPWANSPNHSGRGQYLLYSDGSVSWTTSPDVGGHDNIWLPRSLETRARALTGRPKLEPLSGRELPESSDDAFVGP